MGQRLWQVCHKLALWHSSTLPQPDLLLCFLLFDSYPTCYSAFCSHPYLPLYFLSFSQSAMCHIDAAHVPCGMHDAGCLPLAYSSHPLWHLVLFPLSHSFSHWHSIVLIANMLLPLNGPLPWTGRIPGNIALTPFSLHLWPNSSWDTFDLVRVTPSSINSPHMDEKHKVLVRGLDESLAPFYNILDLDSWPAADLWIQ